MKTSTVTEIDSTVTSDTVTSSRARAPYGGCHAVTVRDVTARDVTYQRDSDIPGQRPGRHHHAERAETLLKLLAVEPESRERIVQITGWPRKELDALLHSLVAQGRLLFCTSPKPPEGPAREVPRIVRLARISERERQIRLALKPRWKSAAER